MTDRHAPVRSRLQELEVDALLITSLPDIRWTCGFTGSNGVLLVGPDEAHFITDGRYSEQARHEVAEASVHVTTNGLSAYVDEHNFFRPFERVAFQADDRTVAQRAAMEEQHPDVSWVPVEKALTRFVAQKEDEEVDAIRAAQRITEAVFDKIVDLIEPGVTEKELAAEITYRHLKQGADRMSFDPIVASGPNSARPHARPTTRTLQSGDVIVLDMGCFLDGYASDMTRTVALGDPAPPAARAYEIVRRAQEEALAVARAGLTGKELDGAARQVIDDEGYGEAFSHGLGHGIGLQVHEWPRVSRQGEEELPEGTCVTIEPGIYLPEEGFGIRIEDIVVLRAGGSEKLTRAGKEFTRL